jgi:hypothetical protein
MVTTLVICYLSERSHPTLSFNHLPCPLTLAYIRPSQSRSDRTSLQGTEDNRRPSAACFGCSTANHRVGFSRYCTPINLNRLHQVLPTNISHYQPYTNCYSPMCFYHAYSHKCGHTQMIFQQLCPKSQISQRKCPRGQDGVILATVKVETPCGVCPG